MNEAAAGPQDLGLRMQASLAAWKRKLLDLSRRNRALNFSPTRASTVLVVDEQPAEVFRQLYLLEQTMTFAAAARPCAPDTGSAGAADELLGDAADAVTAESPAPVRFVPYQRAQLDGRHTDSVLQTASDPDRLDRALRRLDELARSSIEEQGVGTLFLSLGMLEYFESDSSEERLQAPLILMPVELARKSARASYGVRCSNDEPLVNPALVELLRRSHGIGVPVLPDSDAMDERYDLQVFLASLRERIADRRRWAVTNDIVLAQFSFQKFVMYMDLESNAPAFEQHGIVQQLVGRSGGLLSGLPEEIRSLALDAECPPEMTFQVVDADSSQVRAMAAVARGHHLVLEGPPGTGKSQTITNLIAQALAGGKSVLFVAEKMAALQVVHERLKQAGLDEFCLEVHSTKANKRVVMQEVARALNLSLDRCDGSSASTGQLPRVRAELSDYVEAVHQPFGELGLTPYRGYGELEQVADAPATPLGIDVRAITSGELDETTRGLDDLAAVAAPIGDPKTHPWRGCARTFLSAADLETIPRHARELSRCMEALACCAEQVRTELDLAPVDSFAKAEIAAAVGDLLARSPGAPAAVLRSDAWNAPPARALEIIQRGRRIASEAADLGTKLAAPAFDRDHGLDADYVLDQARRWTRLFSFFDGRHREIARRWRGYRLTDHQPSLPEQAVEMRRVDDLRTDRARLAADEVYSCECFGDLWQGENSSWDGLDSYAAWVVEFRGVCVREGLRGRAMDTAAKHAPRLDSVGALRGAVASARDGLRELGAVLGWPEGYLADACFDDIRGRADALVAGAPLGPRWAALESVRQRVAAGPAAALLGPAWSGTIAFPDLSRSYRRAFFRSWLDLVVGERPALTRFHSLTHEQRVREFRTLDKDVLRENREALIVALRRRTQERLQREDAAACMPVLRREMTRLRGLAPLRRTLKGAEAAIRAIKPCFMMSPLTVAQCLPGGAPRFDLVIFDEASQLPPEDSVGAILRGRQLVVVGDPKQLPPTNFFAVMGGQIMPVRGPDGQLLFEDSESILEDFAASGAPHCRLRWHYRSAHESLITFSNVTFYDGELNTFPSVETDSRKRGLRFEFVDDGVYEGSGMNRAEARRVVDAIVEHARSNPGLSLGVGTFSLRQQVAINDELEQRRREDPGVEDFFSAREHEPFFVKNLENIQGDERDVIFLSITYGKAADGRMRYNLAALNAENGWRRLNVLITRARQQMRVFSSIRGDDIDASNPSKGAQLLRGFLAYAEFGRLDHPIADPVAGTESPFEEQVRAELTRRGLKLVSQVGVSGYRIDFGVLDDAHPGRFVCGLECDGASYHSSETARDRDRLRQEVLERRGWSIHRIWSTDWFKDREGQIDRVLRLVEESRAAAHQSAAGPKTDGSLTDALPTAMTTGAPPEVVPTAALPASMPTGAPRGAAPATVPLPVATAEPYRLASGQDQFVGEDLMNADAPKLRNAVKQVVAEEGPIHVDQFLARVAGMWGNRAGSRISRRIMATCLECERGGDVLRRGSFLWPPSGRVQVRDRSGAPMSAEHICPEEYREAAITVLRTGVCFAREDLVAAVRSLLGYSRTGHLLEAAIDGAIQALLTESVVGEGSSGLRLLGPASV